MTDPEPSRLAMLRFARRVVEQQARQQLAQIDQWIADEERAQAAVKPPAPEGWIVVDSWTPTQPAVIHTSTCTEAQGAKRSRPVTDRAEVMQLFYDGATVCPLCNSAATLREP